MRLGEMSIRAWCAPKVPSSIVDLSIGMHLPEADSELVSGYVDSGDLDCDSFETSGESALSVGYYGAGPPSVTDEP